MSAGLPVIRVPDKIVVLIVFACDVYGLIHGTIPFTPNVLQINPPPVFLLYFFLELLREFVAAPIFFCNSHALLGESRGCCTKTKQEWPDSGSTLENIFVIVTKLIPRKIFFVLQQFWC